MKIATLLLVFKITNYTNFLVVNMKLALLSVVILNCILPIQKVIAEPSSCNSLAINIKEKEAVDILQELHLIQSNLTNADKILNKLNNQISHSVNRGNSDSVVGHHDLVNEYNSFINYSNEAEQYYNQQKLIYNDLHSSISVSGNIALLKCLNRQALRKDPTINHVNIDYLDINNMQFLF